MSGKFLLESELAMLSTEGACGNCRFLEQPLKASLLAISKMSRMPIVFFILAICSHFALAEEPTYRLVRCVSVGPHHFDVAFQSEGDEQRSISFSLNGLNFGGNVKGAVKAERVQELRLTPELQVVFSNPEHESLKFGPLSRECQDIIQKKAGAVLKVVDGHGLGPAAPRTAMPTFGEQVGQLDRASATNSASSEPAPLTDALARWPVDTRLSYKVGGFYRSDLNGKAQLLWRRQAERYQVRLLVDMGVMGLAMNSQGSVQAEGLYPSVYDEKVGSSPRRGVDLTDSHIVIANGQLLPRPPRVQDQASQFVEITWRLLSGQINLSQGSSLSYWMVHPGGVDDLVYDAVGLETLQTHLGPLPAWHLVPRPLATPRGNTSIEMWFAPSLQYLPVRIKINMGLDANVDMLIDKIEQAGAVVR